MWAFVREHFTRFSGTLVLLQLATILSLIYIYVPEATQSWLSSWITGGATILASVIALFSALSDRYAENEESDSIVEYETREEPRSNGLEKFTRTEEEILREETERLEEWFVVYEDGEIELTPQKQISGDPYFLLYTIAAKVAYENGKRDSPGVTRQELTTVTQGSIEIFINKAEPYLIQDYDPEEMVPHLEDKQVYEIDVRNLSEAIDWILKGSRNPPEQ